MTDLFSSTRVSWRRLAAIATAGAVTLLSTLPFAQSAQAATGFHRAAYFIGANGSLEVLGSNSDGVWSRAMPLTPANSAPAGASVTAVRGPSGRLLAYYVGNDGAVYESCGAVAGSYAAVTGSGFAPAGSAVSATSAGRVVLLTVGTSSGFSTFEDGDAPVCGTHLVQWGGMPGPRYWTAGGSFATVGYADGELGVFQAGSDGAVHALWGDAAGQWQQAALTSAGVAAPGAGIAATASANVAAPTPGATSIFYAGPDGRVNVEHPAANGLSDQSAALASDPVPVPWKSHIAALSAADGTTQVAYIATTGALFLAGTVNGEWQPPKQISATGFGTAGGSIGIAGSSDIDIDIVYCGTPPNPNHTHVGPGGPVTTQLFTGPVVAGTITAEAQ